MSHPKTFVEMLSSLELFDKFLTMGRWLCPKNGQKLCTAKNIRHTHGKDCFVFFFHFKLS